MGRDMKGKYNSGEEGKIVNATIKNIMNMRKETSEIVRNRDN